MERSLLISICPVVNVIVEGRSRENSIMSPDAASAIACLKDPGPESLIFVTVRVAAMEQVLEKRRKEVTRMNKTL